MLMIKNSQTEINLNEVSEEYSKVKTKYDTLGINLAQALELFLKENDLKVLSVSYRVKDKDSFVGKIDRKNYEKPFDDIEDICGIRIICYYQSDLENIAEIIAKEFEVLENQDKEELLEADRFGYRSTHFIVKIKKEWLKAPNYRGLEDLKAEIQIRTVLMHAWAEIEHNLAYKKESDIPKQFRNKFSQLAAILKNADEQFEELKFKITDYQKEVIEIVQDKSNSSKEIELNLDSLRAFLDTTFPYRSRNNYDTVRLLDEFSKFGIGLKELKDSYEKVEKYLPDIEKDFFGKKPGWFQVGAARIIMELTNEKYFTSLSIPPELDTFGLTKRTLKWREIIQKDEAEKFNK